MKTAFSRLVVSVLALLTAVVTLAASLVNIVARGVGYLASRIPAPARTAQPTAAPVVPVVPVAPAARPNLRLLPTTPPKEAQLATALKGMGFKAPLVDAYVSKADLSKQLVDLLKDGIATCSRAA